MKFSLITAAAFGIAVEAHTIFQRVSINGKDQGSLVGLRAPNNNNPVQDVTSSSLTCGTQGTHSQTVLSVNPGDTLGAWWEHVIGGAQFAGDHDNPIAASHKGPVMAYLAKVDDASTASQSGLQWYKVWEDGFDTSSRKWGVDHMIAANGWTNFTLPSCIAAGQYLLRVEIIALHSAKSQGQAQFYASCAQIKVGGSGSFSPSSSQTVSFPGAYKATDPGILINIYGPTGTPDNGGKAYPVPGPAVISC